MKTSYLAGTQAAGMLISLGAEVVITGSIGPKAFATLAAAGVRVFRAPVETVAQAIDSFLAGKLVIVSAANAEAHWRRSEEA